MNAVEKAAFERGELAVFVNEAEQIVHISEDLSCALAVDYTWLVRIRKIRDVVCAALFEVHYQRSDGLYQYKRSGFLPEMVGKKDFVASAAKAVFPEG